MIIKKELILNVPVAYLFVQLERIEELNTLNLTNAGLLKTPAIDKTVCVCVLSITSPYSVMWP